MQRFSPIRGRSDRRSDGRGDQLQRLHRPDFPAAEAAGDLLRKSSKPITRSAQRSATFASSSQSAVRQHQRIWLSRPYPGRRAMFRDCRSRTASSRGRMTAQPPPPCPHRPSHRRTKARLPPGRQRRARYAVPGTPEGFRCLSGGHESGVSILRRHRRARLDISQAASCGSGEYRRGGGLIIRELGNR